MKKKHSYLPFDFLARLTRTPYILTRTVKGLVRKHLTVKYDYNFLDGKSLPLSQISIKITNVCNLSCVFCPGTERAKRFLSPAEFRLMAEKLLALDGQSGE